MNTALTLLGGAAVFFMGFLIGFSFPDIFSAQRESRKCFGKNRSETESITRELKNFLYYDGSENGTQKEK